MEYKTYVCGALLSLALAQDSNPPGFAPGNPGKHRANTQSKDEAGKVYRHELFKILLTTDCAAQNSQSTKCLYTSREWSIFSTTISQ